MSRLSDLIRDTKRQDPRLGAELESELRLLNNQRKFGLVFEQHRPESVELPGREVRKGDLVRILPPRGTPMLGDKRAEKKKGVIVDPALAQRWEVLAVTPETEEALLMQLDDLGQTHPERTVALDDLVVVSRFDEPIHPGLVETGAVERGGEKPAHVVINAENFHALRMLTYTHPHSVDVIYIDPPYNSRAKDWKYNNDYVDPDDDYNHSKWLAFMERRLQAAKDLLKPDDSVLIVTIDEKEVHRLALLLEQTFPEGRIQMVTSVISAKGVVRKGDFSRVEEHIFFVTFGAATIMPGQTNMLPSYVEEESDEDAANEPSSKSKEVLLEIEDQDQPLEPIEWLGLRRREPSSRRGTRPNQFYPIYVDKTTGNIHSIGDAVDDHVDRHGIPEPDGTVAFWPLKPDGTEMLWGLTPNQLRNNLSKGYVKTTWISPEHPGIIKYLPTGTISRVESGQIVVTGRASDGSVEGHVAPDTSVSKLPKRIWHVKSHNAETGGTNVLAKILPKRRFPYPKSLYAVEDTLRFYVAKKPDAIILDFFAGSGTTAHATMRLNRQDGGRRQCISITNNEVSAEEQERLRTPDLTLPEPLNQGLRAGDEDWDKWGICDYITKPRLLSAITGQTPSAQPIKGAYRFQDEFPMSEGFEENARFFTLTYERPRDVEYGYGYSAIAPLLWMRAGAAGEIISEISPDGWALTDHYGVLFDTDRSEKFLEAVHATPDLAAVFIVTDDQGPYQSISRRLPRSVDVVRLYESYLSNFRIQNWGN